MRNRNTKNLLKSKIIQSWSKQNLYNLRFATPPSTRTRTFFQQKWSAKSLARAYHGEQVREGQWERMFSRRLRAVVPMNARTLAENDGTKESAGRGSGLEERYPKAPNLTPYMQMTFAPLERRLDVAIFRAMFASSTRQARQFVVHGNVTVNGQKMRYPGYLLNPGDLFQVDPERVLFATGASKARNQRRGGRARTAKKKAERAAALEKSNNAPKEEPESQQEQESKENLTQLSAENSTELGTQEEEKNRRVSGALTRLSPKNAREMLQRLLNEAKQFSKSRSAKDMMALRKHMRSAIANSGGSSQWQIEKFERILTQMKPLPTPDSAAAKSSQESTSEKSSEAPTESSGKSKEEIKEEKKEKEASENRRQTVSHLTGVLQQARRDGDTELKETNTSGLSEQDIKILKHALRELEDNPIDSTKPYKTPWQPRDWMSAFAFIPRYLEVNHTVCAAVYLRHPVARPGLAEVPTPFNEAVNGAAFAWYLRRR